MFQNVSDLDRPNGVVQKSYQYMPCLISCPLTRSPYFSPDIWSLSGARRRSRRSCPPGFLGASSIFLWSAAITFCHDELPPTVPEFPFVADLDTRLDIEDHMRAAWVNFKAQEWLGAATFAGVALEAVLLWEVKRMLAAARSC